MNQKKNMEAHLHIESTMKPNANTAASQHVTGKREKPALKESKQKKQLTDAQAQLKREQRRATREGHQKLLFMHLDRAGLPRPQVEYKFHETKNYALDFAWHFCSLETWEEIKLAVEIEGGIYGKDGGGHRSVGGFESNIFKYNALAERGWFLLRFLPEQISMRSTYAIDSISVILRPLWPKTSGGK